MPWPIRPAGFNTQPPEGGWPLSRHPLHFRRRFNTQPPEGGWGNFGHARQHVVVSTHSRLKAAGGRRAQTARVERVSTHSRLKAAGKHRRRPGLQTAGFNTQPPEGGWVGLHNRLAARGCFNTQPPEGGWSQTRPAKMDTCCFNTQPPEGGWGPRTAANTFYLSLLFQHTAA